MSVGAPKSTIWTPGHRDGAERERAGARLFEEVMTFPPPADSPDAHPGMVNFVFAEVWSRPGLERRGRRWITLACVGWADAPQPLTDHVYAALNSGDIGYAQMQEFVLHFAVYAGWPKATQVDRALRQAWSRIQGEKGKGQAPDHPPLTWTHTSAEARMDRGLDKFREISQSAAEPTFETPFRVAGVYNFVFGEVWQRPGLDRRTRRLISLTCAANADAAIAINSLVYSTLACGDLTLEEMNEAVLQFAAYSGWPKASMMDQAVTEAVRRIEQERR